MKTVKFDDFIRYHYLHDSDEVVRYRKMYWELMVIDRMRFNRRINHLSEILNPILEKSHRLYIVNKRFNQ